MADDHDPLTATEGNTMLRFAAALARAIAQMGKDFWNALPTIGKVADDLVSWPFRVLFGGGAPLEHYEPTTTRPDVIETFKAAREAAAVRSFDPSGIETVRKYCNARKDDRAAMDISAVPSEARLLLATMSDDELHALGRAGPGQIKKFLDGKQHGVDGVPVVGVHKPAPANDRSPRPAFNHRQWRDQALLKRDIEHRFKIG